jgi:D-alanyl-lipoteichoic acid acyltransferase DltB (MBOAT superfamily)
MMLSKGLCGGLASTNRLVLSKNRYQNRIRVLTHIVICCRQAGFSAGKLTILTTNTPTSGIIYQYLTVVLVLHFVFRRAFNVVFIRMSPTPPSGSSCFPSHNLTQRKLFDIMFAVTFLTALHSLSVLKILFIIVANFMISFFHPSSSFVPILTWIFNIGVLFANEYYSGYRFQAIFPWLAAGEGAGFGSAMDNFLGGGILNRWHISFNITILRLISYNMDHHWAAVRAKGGYDLGASVAELGHLTPRNSLGSIESVDFEPSVEDVIHGDRLVDSQEQLMEQPKRMRMSPEILSEKDRVDLPAEMRDYSLLNYMAYVLYTPLYLAGPIITFNDFIHQVGHTCSLYNWVISNSDSKNTLFPASALREHFYMLFA